MPHAIIEYSEPLRPLIRSTEAVRLVHEAMIKSGVFNTADIKTRAHATDDFLVGEMGRTGSFIHVRIYLLEGRTSEQKQGLTEAIRTTLATALPQVNQLSVDIRDMVKETYRKYVS